MGTQGEGKPMLKRLGIAGAVAAAGAGVGLLISTKPKRLRETVAELPGSARDLVTDLSQRLTRSDGGWTEDMTSEIPDHFEARRRERRQRREQRRQHATR